ncbi:hypothetical protein HWV62_9809 [Athelia sp. TMB]|nr:hypothetical protein HWV62_42199 [Athelia sp. TMB]KAF7975352.1 hypothetical protein HWV62_9809 [Athelia sp. TMB]
MMGFFSSKKAESQDSYMDHSEKSVVQTIRSRLSGKSKGKEREVISSPVPSSTRLPNGSRLGDNLVPINHKLGLQGSTLKREGGPSSQPVLNKSHSAPSTSSRTDVITDEEYRLLRQSLFERFASGDVAPSEAPHVPLARPGRSSIDGRASLSSQTRPASQFQVDPARTPSLRTKPSMASTVSTLFRRASRRTSSGMPQSSAASDASSVFSMSSQQSNTLRWPLNRGLSRKTSDTSIRTEVSRAPYESSFNSRPNSAMEQYLSPSRSTTRSLRRLATATPPSSFPARLPGVESTKPSPTSADVFSDDNLQTAKDIRREMEVVEAEGRRLMDAFNGLELTTLTRRRHQPPRLPPIITHTSDGSRSINGDLSSSLSPDRRRGDMDAFSVRSNTSAGTTFSAAKSQHSRRLQSSHKPVSLLRKSSFSSVSSSSRAGSLNGMPPLPSLPTPLSSLSLMNHIGIDSSSSVNLSRPSPLSTLAESEIVDRRSFAEARIVPGFDHEDADIIALEGELNDIRKRRGEVTARYEARLEYLRAKLKGAELHEKLLRK